MLAILDKIAYLYERTYKIRNCIKYVSKFLLVSVVTRYEEKFKGFKKGYKISFWIFWIIAYFPHFCKPYDKEFHNFGFQGSTVPLTRIRLKWNKLK